MGSDPDALLIESAHVTRRFRWQWIPFLGGSLAIGIFNAFNNYTLTLWLTAYTSSYFLLGLMGNSKSFEGAIVSPLVGSWSDRVWHPRLGRRRPFILAGGVISGILLTATPYVGRLFPEGAQLIAIVAMIFFFTLSFNMMDDIHKALLPEISPPDERDRLSGISTVVDIGSQVGLLAVGALLWQSGVPDSAFALAGFLVALGAIVVVVGVREERNGVGSTAEDEDVPAGSPWKILTLFPAAAMFYLVFFFYWSGVNAVLPLISVYVRDILHTSEGDAQLLPAFLLLSTTVMAVPAGLLATKIGRRKVMAAGFILMVISALFALVITTKEEGVVLFTFAGIGNAAAIVLGVPLLAELVPKRYLGAGTGILAACGSIAAPVASLLGGVLSDIYGPRAIFGMMAVMVSAGLLFLPWTRPKTVAVEQGVSDDVSTSA